MAIVNRKLSPYEKEYYNKQNKQQEAIWAQQQKEAQQGLDTAKWTQGYQTTELKRNVGTNVINRGVARGTIGSGMIAQGMTPINQQYQQSLQTYNNWLAQNGLDRAAWAIQQWANTHKESSGGGGYIGPDGKRYSSYAAYLKSLSASTGAASGGGGRILTTM